MSDFINTIDLLGDDVVCESIINKTITEFKDNVITSVGKYAFYLCSELATVDLPNVTSVGVSAFRGCKKLTIVDLPNVTSIGGLAFMDCTALTTVILRSETMCTLGNENGGNNFTSTPIASKTGYIYVPSALVDSYKTAWSYANQFRALEDYTVDGTTTGELDLTKI